MVVESSQNKFSIFYPIALSGDVDPSFLNADCKQTPVRTPLTKKGGESKIYIPISKSKFLGLIGTKKGAICPIVSNGESRFHVTLGFDESGSSQIFNVHVTDELSGRHESIAEFRITDEVISKFKEKSESFKANLLSILQKEWITIESREKLYCIDCLSSRVALPSNFAENIPFWKNFGKISEEEVLVYKNCTNSNHKIFYHNQTHRLLHYQFGSTYLPQNKRLIQKVKSLYARCFSEELEVLDRILQKIKTTVRQQRVLHAKASKSKSVQEKEDRRRWKDG